MGLNNVNSNLVNLKLYRYQDYRNKSILCIFHDQIFRKRTPNVSSEVFALCNMCKRSVSSSSNWSFYTRCEL